MAPARPDTGISWPPSYGPELVDRDRLGERVGQSPVALERAIDDGVRAVLGL